MSDSEDSMVTYTAVSSPFTDFLDIGSPRVDAPPMMAEDPYAYVVAAFQAPPSPDYVSGPEYPISPINVLRPNTAESHKKIWQSVPALTKDHEGNKTNTQMDDPNITIEECIRLEEEKAQKRGKVFNWETAKYGKIWYDEDVHDLRSVATKFPAIVFKDNLTSNGTLLLLKIFENEFPAIVYNDALTSKSDFSTEPTLCPQHIDEFDLKDETSLSEYDEVKQNVSYFNDLFPFNIIYPDDLKSDKDNDDNEIDMIQSSGGNENTQGSNKLLEASHDKINKVFIMKSFVMELNVNMVAWNYLVNGMLLNLIKNLYVLFGIPFDPKRYYKDGIHTRMLRRPRQIFIRHMTPLPPRDQRHLWLRYQDQGRDGVICGDTLCFQLGGARHNMTWRQFILALGLHTVEEMQRMDLVHTAQYLFRHAEGRKSGARLSGGHFIGRFARHFGLVSDDGLRGLSVVTREIPFDMGDLVKINICMEIGDDWAWVAPRQERQPDAANSALGAAKDAPAVDEGRAPQPPPPPPVAGRTMPQRLERLEDEMQGAGVAYTRYFESPIEYQRRSVRQRTDEPNTSTAPQHRDP
ncbi:hypothetical protein Tco_0809410 [Tanacetum coccineum]